MAQFVEVSAEEAELITQRAHVVERRIVDGERRALVSIPQVDDGDVTAGVLRRVLRIHRRLWGKRGNGDD